MTHLAEQEELSNPPAPCFLWNSRRFAPLHQILNPY
jgi:hypothetical protein